jgi:hypothetical protein
MSQYYRGGARVPSTRTVITNDGPRYVRSGSGGVLNYNWRVWISGGSNYSGFTWGDDPGSKYGLYYVNVGGQNSGVTSFSFMGATYLRGNFRETVGGGTTFNPRYSYYEITRQTSSTVSINTGVPSSGTISISQLFGAANP